MSYRDQISTVKSLHKMVNADLKLRIDAHKRDVFRAWKDCRRELISGIVQAYMIAAPKGKWNIHSFRNTGIEQSLRAFVQGQLTIFRAQSIVAMRKAFKDLRKKSAIRHAWILDQVTPESMRVNIPTNVLREADPSVGPEIWVDRWSEWLESYESSLYHNIVMHAMNEGDLKGAVDEVDATRMNTPAATLENALSRLFDFKSYESIAAGEDDIASLNDYLIAEEIWITSGRANICDECADNEGKTADEVDSDIPAHPKCECFWEMHPKKYADLLRSGNPEDRALAEQMERQGIDGGALVIRTEDGEVAAKAIMSFRTWQDKIIGVLTGGTR